MKENKRDKRLLIPRDEFEEEASEGLGRLSREEAEADLRELKARMESRLRRPRAIWLPAAAAVALLLAASAVVVSLLRERPGAGPELAEVQAPAAEIIADTAYIAMAGPIEKADYPSGEEVSAARFVPPLVPEAADDYELPADTDTGHEYMVEMQVDDRQVKVEPVVTLVVAEEEKAKEVVVQAVPQMAQYSKKGRPVIETRDEKKAVTGEDTLMEAVRAGAVNSITEQEATGQPVISSGVTPVGGWDKFMKWAARNIRYPEGIEPVVRQVVTVSFRVQPDSTLTDLRAVSSPGEPFTREAFRLLREGPKWVPAGGGVNDVAGEVILKIVFK